MREIARCGALGKVHLATDYFDASINRIAAWAVGLRNTRKALLFALLEPTKSLKNLEEQNDRTGILIQSQESLTLPFGAVWDYYCESKGVQGSDWINAVKDYEKNILSKRG
jgi:L-rhamnose isomerase